MDYDRLALLLLVRGSSRGFRKALKHSPAATLNKAGFNPAEVAQLMASLNKIKASQPSVWNSAIEQEVAFSFNMIATENVTSGGSSADDWSTC